ncbi:iron-containing alcohol dehydrogenase [Peptoniphilus equinus]|uniref:Iron-containing alcohol dehydrogenase n=1 Tax=Peptoniphilus equinus TaxID=3016343 RepID=A0ABY7QTV8_9FIRM|nr:iron-containing alcohol dehydrogenase [Peptoniphilus equinus]WBW50211.1 iron-containing alcohol dehydrogenase [Peptoniphilus equinus]
MKDFIYHNPTKIFFGTDHAHRIAEEIKTYGDSVLMVYGGGSIKTNGVYDDIKGALLDGGLTVTELSGVQPNPRVASAREGIRLARDNQVDFVLAVGGGSVIDCAKLICAGFYYDGDPWNIVTKGHGAKVERALPLGSVLTLSATGSEMDSGSVITNPDTQEKLGWGTPLVQPKFSLLNPAYTNSVNPWHTAAGLADIMSHTMENYFTVYDDAFMQDSFAEGILKTCVHYGPVALQEPDNYEARSNIMWAGTWAINGLIDTGKPTAWSVHPMEHELSAFYDITHGVGLAILTPRWLRHVLDETTAPKIARMGRQVFGLVESDTMKAADAAIDALYHFFESIGIPMHLKDVGIDDTQLEAMAAACLVHTKGTIHGFVDMNEEDVLEIYKACL